MLPAIHPAIYNWVIHRIGHGQPVNRQIGMLHMRKRNNPRYMMSQQEVNVIWKPADSKDYNNNNHHLNNLEKTQ